MHKRQIILDTETTGLSPSDGHRIIEVAAVEMINRRFTGNYLHLYINPQRGIDPEAQKVHGLTEKFLMDKPIFNHIADELFDYINGNELIIHNAPFDLGFLNHEFQELRRNFVHIESCCTIIDTLVMARNKHRGQKNNLDALCNRYNIDRSSREKHGALIDAKLLGEVYIAMTGGQISLFDMDHSQDTQKNIQSTQSIKQFSQRSQSQAFKILRATEDELQAHEAYMEEIQD
jgi:DNA polymerase III subunit epsilon